MSRMQATANSNESKVNAVTPLKIPKFALGLNNKLGERPFYHESQDLMNSNSCRGNKQEKNLLTRCRSSGNIFSDLITSPRSPDINEALLSFTRLRYELFPSKLATENSPVANTEDQFTHDPTTSRSKSLSVDRSPQAKPPSDVTKQQLFSTIKTDTSYQCSPFSPRDLADKFQNSPKAMLTEDQLLLTKYRMSSPHHREGSAADFLNQINEALENDVVKKRPVEDTVIDPLLRRNSNYQTISQLKKNHIPLRNEEKKGGVLGNKFKDPKSWRSFHKSLNISKDFRKIDQSGLKEPLRSGSNANASSLQFEGTSNHHQLTFSLEKDKSPSQIISNKGCYGNLQQSQASFSKPSLTKHRMSLDLRANSPTQSDIIREAPMNRTHRQSNNSKEKVFLIDPNIQNFSTPRQLYSATSPKNLFSAEKNKPVKALHKADKEETAKINENKNVMPSKSSQQRKSISIVTKNGDSSGLNLKDKGKSTINHKRHETFASLSSLRNNFVGNNVSPSRKESAEEYGLAPKPLTQTSKLQNTQIRNKFQEFQASPEKYFAMTKKLPNSNGKILKPASEESKKVEKNNEKKQQMVTSNTENTEAPTGSQVEVEERMVIGEEFVIGSQACNRKEHEKKNMYAEETTFSEIAQRSKKEVSKSFGNPLYSHERDDELGFPTAVIEKEINIELLDPMVSVREFDEEELIGEKRELITIKSGLKKTETQKSNLIENVPAPSLQSVESDNALNQETKIKQESGELKSFEMLEKYTQDSERVVAAVEKEEEQVIRSEEIVEESLSYHSSEIVEKKAPETEDTTNTDACRLSINKKMPNTEAIVSESNELNMIDPKNQNLGEQRNVIKSKGEQSTLEVEAITRSSAFEENDDTLVQNQISDAKLNDSNNIQVINNEFKDQLELTSTEDQNRVEEESKVEFQKCTEELTKEIVSAADPTPNEDQSITTHQREFTEERHQLSSQSNGNEITELREQMETNLMNSEKETIEDHINLQSQMTNPRSQMTSSQNETPEKTSRHQDEEKIESNQAPCSNQILTVNDPLVVAQETIDSQIHEHDTQSAAQENQCHSTDTVDVIPNTVIEENELKTKTQSCPDPEHNTLERNETNSETPQDKLQKKEEEYKLDDCASTLEGTTHFASQSNSLLSTPASKITNKPEINSGILENFPRTILPKTDKFTLAVNVSKPTEQKLSRTNNAEEINTLIDNDDELLQMSPLQILKSLKRQSMLDLVKSISAISDNDEENEKSSFHILLQLTEQAESFSKLGHHEEAIRILKQVYEKIEKLNFQKDEDIERKDNLHLYCSNYLSVEYFSLKNYTEALNWANNTIKNDPFNLQGLCKAYQCERKLGMSENAKLLMKKCQKLLCSPYAIIRSKYSMVEKLTFGDSDASSVTNPSATDSTGYQYDFDDVKPDQRFGWINQGPIKKDDQ